MCLLKSTCTDGLDYVHVDTCRMSKSCCIQVTMTLEKGRILCLKQSIVVHTCTLFFFKEIRHTCMKFSVYFGTHIYSKGHVHALWQFRLSEKMAMTSSITLPVNSRVQSQ